MNYQTTLSLLEGMRTVCPSAHMIFLSSRGVYGIPQETPTTEHTAPNPHDFYGLHKLAAEQACRLYNRQYGLAVTIARLCNVYGPRCQVRSPHYGTINMFIRYALEGTPMPVFGTGKQRRDYIYIDDVVAGLCAMMEPRARGETFLLGSGTTYDIWELTLAIQRVLLEAQATRRPMPPILSSLEFPIFQSNPHKATRLLRWEPTTDLDTGIARTVAYYQQYLEHYQ